MGGGSPLDPRERRTQLLARVQDEVRALWLLTAPRGQAIPTPVCESGSRGLPPQLDSVGASLRDETIMPRLLRGDRLGVMGMVGTALAIPGYKYAPRVPVLELMNAGLGTLRKGFSGTEYFGEQTRRHGRWTAARKIAAYYRLFRTLADGATEVDLAERRGLAILFIARDICFRIDGTHRASIWRYLGYADLPALLVRPHDIAALAGVPRRVLDWISQLEEAKAAYRPVEATISPAEVRIEIERLAPWYQSIDFGYRPALRTRPTPPRARLAGAFGGSTAIAKNAAVHRALDGEAGRRLVELGCNSGLYSCFAAMRGAESVLGLDLDARAIEQARAIAEIFRRQGRLDRPVSFERFDIREHPELLADRDTLLACAVLYHLGPVAWLVAAIRASSITRLILQGDTARERAIGRKNRPGQPGYELDAKTWGNVLGTADGLRRFIGSCGFEVVRTLTRSAQYPVLIAERLES